MDLEEIIMGIIVNGGGAKSKALEAIQAARAGDFPGAEALMCECEAALAQAHKVHTHLLTLETGGERDVTVTLLMVHAQDHLMSAVTTRDLALELVEVYRRIP
ncbi:MAG TPA: PTS lactose/cellobiose transporter subunit IIA [Pseudoflavonifractor sp.]|nr:PTS lactose/cellobiose transporter subunit IIA [Pseudoflavonifractor sp.]